MSEVREGGREGGRREEGRKEGKKEGGRKDGKKEGRKAITATTENKETIKQKHQVSFACQSISLTLFCKFFHIH